MQIKLNETLVHYEVLGNGKPLLILHGWRRSSQEWLPVARGLVDQFRVYILDLPGHGSSPIPQGEAWEFTDYTNLITGFIDKKIGKKTVVVGHSIGGKIAISAAGSANISKLVLIAPSGIEETPHPVRIKLIIISLLRPLLKVMPKTMRHTLVHSIASRDYKEAGELTETFKKLVKVKVIEEASNIKVPTLIIWGSNDTEIAPKTAKKLHNLIRRSRIRIVWGAGHSPHTEKLDKLLSILKEEIA